MKSAKPFHRRGVPTPAADSAVSVEALIVSYETRDLLLQSIQTLLAHPPRADVARLSVAVLDNASTDGSADMLTREFPSVRLVRSESNLGFAAANNRLAATSTADYVLLLNPDVVVVEDLVAPLLEALREDPTAIVAGPRLVSPDGSPQYSSQEFPSLGFELARALHQTKAARVIRPVFDTAKVIGAQRQHTQLDSRERRRTSFLWATCWLISKAEIETNGLFDERYVTYDEDLDFCRRRHDGGRCAVFVPGVRLIHLGGSSSTSARKQAMMQNGRLRYFGDHGGRVQRLIYRLGPTMLVRAKGLTARARGGRTNRAQPG